MDHNEVLRNSFLFMYGNEPIGGFLKDCEISFYEQPKGYGRTFEITFTVPATTFKANERNLDFFRAKLKEDLHKFHQYKSVIVYITADWEKLEMVSTNVVPILTPWEEINGMQNHLINQLHTADQTISFQNVGNTSRNLLRKLSDIVFDDKKHAIINGTFDTSPESFKNRLWAFVLFKFTSSATNTKVKEYAMTLLECSDKGINLSNAVTHSFNADAFLAQSCAISTISTVHLIKLAYERPDPI